MNRYSLSSDSGRWWCAPAIAGTIGAAAVSAILVVPVMGAPAVPIGTPADDPAPPVVTDSIVLIDRPCYLARPGWGTPAGWEQPVCSTEIHGGTKVPAPGERRSAPDHLP